MPRSIGTRCGVKMTSRAWAADGSFETLGILVLLAVPLGINRRVGESVIRAQIDYFAAELPTLPLAARRRLNAGKRRAGIQQLRHHRSSHAVRQAAEHAIGA